MPKILISEIVQVIIYIVFGVVVTLTKFDLPLYFGLGFVLATCIPSILLGYGFKGIKPAMKTGNTNYEKFRGTAFSNGLWGLVHFILAFVIYLDIKDKFNTGLNLETFLIAMGFCCIYITVSISQKSDVAK